MAFPTRFLLLLGARGHLTKNANRCHRWIIQLAILGSCLRLHPRSGLSPAWRILAPSGTPPGLRRAADDFILPVPGGEVPSRLAGWLANVCNLYLCSTIVLQCCVYFQLHGVIRRFCVCLFLLLLLLLWTAGCSTRAYAWHTHGRRLAMPVAHWRHQTRKLQTMSELWYMPVALSRSAGVYFLLLVSESLDFLFTGFHHSCPWCGKGAALGACSCHQMDRTLNRASKWIIAVTWLRIPEGEEINVPLKLSLFRRTIITMRWFMLQPRRIIENCLLDSRARVIWLFYAGTELIPKYVPNSKARCWLLCTSERNRSATQRREEEQK